VERTFHAGSREPVPTIRLQVVASKALAEELLMALDTFFYMFATAMLGGILAELDQIRKAVQKK